MEEFTRAEQRALEGHFSNHDRPVFAITTPSQADRGALMSRYSRTAKSMRRVFLDEFAGDASRGEKFYERVLGEYGDDSVAELGGAQAAVEGISNIAVKKMQDRRIGLSFLEKSTRYVRWDTKEDGKYRFLREPRIAESPLANEYEDACNASFDAYSDSLEPVLEHVERSSPVDDMKFKSSETGREVKFGRLSAEDARAAEAAHRRASMAKALDLLRGLLPASALTNVGVTGNGRAFEYLITVLRGSRLDEERAVGEQLYSELGRVIGPFVKRSDGPHGRAARAYLESAAQKCRARARRASSAPGRAGARVSLAGYPPERGALDAVVSALLYEHSEEPYRQVNKRVRAMTRASKARMISELAALRGSRRHRPPRAFECVEYSFDVVSSFGAFRDLHRHRLLTMHRQLLTARLGYDVPRGVAEAGCEKRFRECMRDTKSVYERLRARMPEQAQYVVNLAFNYRYMMRMNLREATHLVELRTTQQGHDEYRGVAGRMHELVREAHPALSRIIKFADPGAARLGRLEAEKKGEYKRRAAGR